MRTRDLKPSFFRDLELTQLPAITRILYQGLWCRADREGRQDDIPALIKADIFPLENVNVEKNLKILEQAGRIIRYEIDGVKCIWIPKFKRHQHPHPKEADSVLPAHPQEAEILAKAGIDSEQGPVEPRKSNGSAPEIPGKTGEGSSHTLSSSPSIPSNTLTTALPATGELTARMPFKAAEIETLLSEFPGVNVNARWREFADWIEGRGGGGARERPKDLYEAFRGFLKRPARRIGEEKIAYIAGGVK